MGFDDWISYAMGLYLPFFKDEIELSFFMLSLL